MVDLRCSNLFRENRVIDKSTVSPITIEDYEPTAIFLEDITNKRFNKSFWLDRFEYWWDKNPAMTENIIRGCVIRGKNGGIGGFFGNIPIKYYIMGEEKVACCTTSWYVGEEYKKRSLELLIPFLKQKGAAFLLDTTPSEKVAKMLIQIDFKNLDKEWLRKDAFYLVNLIEFWSYFTRRYVSNKALLFLFKVIGILVIPAIKLFQIILKLRFPKMYGKYTFSEIQRFGKSYTLLWEKFKEKYNVLAVRNEVTLNWFFFGSKDLLSSRKVIELRYIDEIIGYVAVKEVGHNIHGKVYYSLEVVDMVILNNQTSAYDVALKGLLWLARNSEKKIIFILINPFVENIKHCLLKHGYFIIRGKSRFLYKQTGEHDNDLCESIDKGYYATPLDGDRCFFP